MRDFSSAVDATRMNEAPVQLRWRNFDLDIA